MLDCDKRQTVVKRSEGLTILRCLNKQCEAWGQEVDEEACALCTKRVTKHVKPCAKPVPIQAPAQPPQPETPPADIVMTDLDIQELLKDSGFESEGLDTEVPFEFLGDDEPTPTSGEAPQYPNLGLQLWMYKAALSRWNKAGRPTRSPERVEEILETHCKRCDWYDPTKKRCKGCGCKVTNGAVAVINKIKMATETCPKNIW